MTPFLPWLLYLGFAMLHGRALLTETHAPKLDERATMRLIALRQQPEPEAGPDAWPIVAAAADITREIEAAERAKLDPDGPIFFDFTSLLPGPTDVTEQEQAQYQVQRKIAARALAEARRRGVFELLAPAATAPRSPPAEAGDPQSPRLSSLRQLTRLSVARMYDASTRADWDDYTDAARDIHALARIAAQQATLIGRLVGMACSEVALREIRISLIEHRDVPEPALRRLVADLDAQLQFWPPRSTTVEADHFGIICALQTAFTDDGSGDGFPILSLLEPLISFPFGALDEADERATQGLPPLGNLYGVTLARKSSTFAVIDHFYERLVQFVELDRPARGPGLRETTEWANSLPRRHAVARSILEVWVPSNAKWLETEDEHLAHLLGTRIMLALELYQRHHGRYPLALAELVPEFLPELPGTDPISGHPLIYRPMDHVIDPHDRPYLLYSRGHDAIDNGGRVYANYPRQALSSHEGSRGRGHDYIINAPRDR